MRHIKFIAIIPLFLLQIVHASETDPSLRKLLLADDDASMVKIFGQGDSLIPKLIVALDDPDEKVAIHAQFMLRLIGSEDGIQKLHEWYGRPKPGQIIANAPVPVPLREWDYEWIAAILEHKTDYDVDDYFYALSIDQSIHAQDLLKKMIDVIHNRDSLSGYSQMVAELKHCSGCATVCAFSTPQKMVRKNAFFL